MTIFESKAGKLRELWWGCYLLSFTRTQSLGMAIAAHFEGNWTRVFYLVLALAGALITVSFAQIGSDISNYFNVYFKS